LREAAADSITPQLVEVKLSGQSGEFGALIMRYHDAEMTITIETPADVLTMALQVLKQL